MTDRQNQLHALIVTSAIVAIVSGGAFTARLAGENRRAAEEQTSTDGRATREERRAGRNRSARTRGGEREEATWETQERTAQTNTERTEPRREKNIQSLDATDTGGVTQAGEDAKQGKDAKKEKGKQQDSAAAQDTHEVCASDSTSLVPVHIAPLNEGKLLHPRHSIDESDGLDDKEVQSLEKQKLLIERKLGRVTRRRDSLLARIEKVTAKTKERIERASNDCEKTKLEQQLQVLTKETTPLVEQELGKQIDFLTELLATVDAQLPAPEDTATEEGAE